MVGGRRRGRRQGRLSFSNRHGIGVVAPIARGCDDDRGVRAVQGHWDEVYAERDPRRVSWFEPTPELSLKMIEATGLPGDAGIIDAGGGASRLAGELVRRGYGDVTVADLSKTALDRARRELGKRRDAVTWVVADLCDHDFGRRFALWHDRAAFHFLVAPDQRERYLETMRRSLDPGASSSLPPSARMVRRGAAVCR
jgi:SAM-dependent methyltransferase